MKLNLSYLNSMVRITFLLFIALASFSHADPITTPDPHKRSADQTYLTYPEWFLVHSPDEYATFIKENGSSNFPYFSHIQQFWQGYQTVYNKIKDDYSFNLEYHIVVSIIGTSTTLEYAFKGAYEKTIGKLTELASFGNQTEEDLIAAEEARRYTDFLLKQPWYKFDFTTSLKRLWFETSFFDWNMLRKLERKYILTTEYLLKAGYGWLIGLGTATSFEAPILETAVITSGPDGQNKLQYLPRYRPFTRAATELAVKGINFVEIAGNRNNILISLWASPNWNSSVISGNSILEQPIYTQNGVIRHVVEIKVDNLSEALRYVEENGLFLEHIYDY